MDFMKHIKWRAVVPPFLCRALAARSSIADNTPECSDRKYELNCGGEARRSKRKSCSSRQLTEFGTLCYGRELMGSHDSKHRRRSIGSSPTRFLSGCHLAIPVQHRPCRTPCSPD